VASAQYNGISHLAQDRFDLVKPAIGRKKKTEGLLDLILQKDTAEKIEVKADTRYALFSAFRAILFQDLKKSNIHQKRYGAKNQCFRFTPAKQFNAYLRNTLKRVKLREKPSQEKLNRLKSQRKESKHLVLCNASSCLQQTSKCHLFLNGFNLGAFLQRLIICF